LNGPIQKTDQADKLLPVLKEPKPAIEDVPPKACPPSAPRKSKRLLLAGISHIDEMADGVAIAQPRATNPLRGCGTGHDSGTLPTCSLNALRLEIALYQRSRFGVAGRSGMSCM